MAELRPIRALRYAADAGDPGELLAPPFDVVGPEEAADLRARHPHNAVRLVLPESGRSGDGARERRGGSSEGRYRRADRTLREWRERGILVRDPEPGVYLYRQRFQDETGGERTRSALLAALRLAALDAGQVLPHEETHRGPKEDRLALTEATGAQLSPVFLVAPDPAGRLPALIDRAIRGTPVLDAETPEGLRHRLWRVVEGPLAEQLREAAGDGPLLIADGHHRYETALELARGTPEGHPARRILACVVGASDPGLVCLPTHRALHRPPGERDRGDGDDGPDARAGRGEPEIGRWRRFLEHAFELRELDLAGGPDAPRAGAADAGAVGRTAAAAAEAGAMVAVPGDGSGEGAEAWLLRPRTGAARAAEGSPGREHTAGRSGPTPDASGPPPAPVAFDRLVLRRGYGIGPDPAVERGLLGYHRDAGAAVREAGPGGAAFLLPPPDVDAVRDAAERGERLPPKSTYFWPKLPSGVLFRPLGR